MNKNYDVNNNLGTIDTEQLNLLFSAFENFSRDFLQNNSVNNSTMSMDHLSKHIELFLNSTENNSTMLDSERLPMTVIVSITFLYFIIFTAGLLGNIITCIVISRNKHMKTATNYYLFNLAISDLLLLLSGMPIDVYNMWFPGSYPFNHLICVVTGLLAETSTNATVLTITSFTVERYIAICHPFRQHTMSKISRTIRFIIAIWILAFCLASPQAFQYSVLDFPDGRLCTVKTVDKSDAVFAYAFQISGFIFFVGPMTLICVLYVLIGLKLKKSKFLQEVKRVNSEHDRSTDKKKGQTRVIRMLIAVAVAFFLCWAPFHAQRLMAVYGKLQQTPSAKFTTFYLTLTYISGILYFLSTCINPLLYSIMSHKFRDAFKSTLLRHCYKNKKNQQSHTYCALSHYGGSLRTTTNRISHTDLNGKVLRQNSLNGKLTLQLLNNQNGNNYYTNPKRQQYQRSNSNISNNSTIFTTTSHVDIQDDNKSNDCELNLNTKNNQETKQSSNNLTTIAEILRRSTRSILNLKNPSIGGNNHNNSSNNNSSDSHPEIIVTAIQEKTLNIEKSEILNKQNSVESDHTNTISNSSLQEVDDEEFSSTELAKFMGEVNNDIRHHRIG